MALIPTRSTSLLLLTLAGATALIPAAYGQDAPTTSSKAQKLEWPRTFSGQPDFSFTRAEAMVEARTRATRENEPMPLPPSMEQLVNDDTALDPLRVNAPKQEAEANTSGTTVSGTEAMEATPRGESLMERLMSQSVDLPALAAEKKPDLSEFSTRLSATISSTVANWQPSTQGYDFQAALNGLVLQAIVTSPVKYAVINQQRYAEGETFRITIPMMVPDHVIMKAARAELPVSGTLPPALQQEYLATFNNILAGFNGKRKMDPSIGRQTLVLPVRITGITPREVLLELNGKPYALNIRYAY